MSVKRYDFEFCQSVECENGHYVLHFDYAALLARIARREELVQRLLDNNPNETIADNGATVLCAWRHDASRALEEK